MIVKTRFIPPGFKAFALFGRVFVRPDFAGDGPLIEHEKTHLRQQAERGLFVWLWMYFTCRECRLKFEVEAYRVQLGMQPDYLKDYRRRQYAGYLAKKYYLGISQADAEAILVNT